MISIQSTQNGTCSNDQQIHRHPSNGDNSCLTRSNEAMIYHIFCGIYLIFLMMILTLFIVNSYKAKYVSSNSCTEFDANYVLFFKVFSILFYSTLLLASGLIFTSLKYVSEYEHQSLLSDHHAQQMLKSIDGQCTSSEASKAERIEEFIRRNSSAPTQKAVSAIQRNPSDLSNSNWLHSVRNEAYETHRRLSTAQPMSRPSCDAQSTKYSPEIVIEPSHD